MPLKGHTLLPKLASHVQGQVMAAKTERYNSLKRIQMKISFDLDQTLIPGNNEFETEKRNFIQLVFNLEKIRKGTVNLIQYLQSEGHEISIYTTSYRTPYKIRLNLLTYGLKIKNIVTQSKNNEVLKNIGIRASKYPPAFAFELHIDDSEGVGIEGLKFNFKTIIISPNDINWCDKIIQNIKVIC